MSAVLSVIMPVYNAENTVIEALESLWNQTRPADEIIVIDDGSTDRTASILKDRKEIRYIRMPHRGIVSTLNEGLKLARGNFIARMDADDISMPERFEKQIQLLDGNSDIGVASCLVTYAGDRFLQKGYASYVDWVNQQISSEQIAMNRFIESPIAHPSVIFRKSVIDRSGGYRSGNFPEDYELWLRLMHNGVKFEKVKEHLLVWNDFPGRLSRNDCRYSSDSFYRMKSEYILQFLKKKNPPYPNTIIWGAGRVTRKRADILKKLGLNVTHYIDIKKRKLNCNTPVLLPEQLPEPGSCYIISLVGNRGARQKIRKFLTDRGYFEEVHFLMAA